MKSMESRLAALESSRRNVLPPIDEDAIAEQAAERLERILIDCQGDPPPTAEDDEAARLELAQTLKEIREQGQ